MLTWPDSAYPRPVKVVFLVYSIGFLVGTYTHTKGILEKGLLAFPVPLAIGLFWDALTLLDFLTVLLLWWRPKAGLWLALAIMVSDISINTGVYLAGYFGSPIPNMVPLDLFIQALFGLFVFVAAPVAASSLRQQVP